MYNTMSGVNVADKLGLDSEVRELKFGSSFTSGGRNQQQGSFHSVRYDFKPASVDTSKMATLDVGPNGQVTISMPNVDGNGTTVFKGARKPYAKECVLIIDHETGEVVLEKLTHNIQVKRTREEGGSKKGASLSMPVVPPLPPPVDAKKTQHPSSSFKMDSKQLNSRDRDEPKKPLLPVPSSQIQHQHQANSNKRGPSNSPKPPPPPQRQSPNNGPSPGHSVSPPLALSPPSTGPAYDSHRSVNTVKQSQAQQNNLLSLTNFEDLLSMAPMNPPPLTKPKVDKPSPKETIVNASAGMPQAKPASAVSVKSNINNVSALSESSSGEDSSSSSSSDEDDSSDDMEDVPDKVPIPQAPEIPQAPAIINNNRGRPQPVAPSMPTDLLCDDLQLSESGSDSE
ncbi:unnamed protein product [Orchesella dallaii]|uniref:Ell-associated factor Eaf n=1 Tax=Orchesella dallaii TaxID=48710 RepID=A0ABP1QCH9_9HEXA